jgi:hypothetical protein
MVDNAKYYPIFGRTRFITADPDRPLRTPPIDTSSRTGSQQKGPDPFIFIFAEFLANLLSNFAT